MKAGTGVGTSMGGSSMSRGRGGGVAVGQGGGPPKLPPPLTEPLYNKVTEAPPRCEQNGVVLLIFVGWGGAMQPMCTGEVS